MPDQWPTEPTPAPETPAATPLISECSSCSRTIIERPDLIAGWGHAVKTVDEYHAARPTPGRLTVDAPEWRYRVTTYYGDDAQPPKIGGELCVQTYHLAEIGVDIAVADGTAMPDVGAILVEQRATDDAGRGNPRATWSALRRFTRTPEGWEHS